MKKITNLFLAFVLVFVAKNSSFAQQAGSPYALAWQYDAPALGVGLSYGLVSHFLWNPKISGMSEAQIMALNTNDLWAIDRPTTQNYSKTARDVSDVFLGASISMPAILLFDPAIRRDYQTVGTMYAETMLLNFLATDLTKQLVLRPRPFTYNNSVSLSDKMDQDARFSFFSGHTSTVAASSFFVAKIYNDYHPNNPETPWIWAAAATLPAATAFLRTQGGKHFPTDVIVGYLVGAGIGLLVPQLHRIKK